MQSKNSKIQTRPIEDLLGRIRTLRQQGQKQIVIPAGEADRLADSLSQVMTRMVTIQEEIIEALKEDAPVIAFGKGCWFALGEMAKSNASALGIDWTCSARNARYLTGGNITLQGNFAPI